MCGLAGYLNLRKEQPAERSVLKRMCDLIAHRGPDAEGLLLEGPIALGHRRLAIVDLSPSGAQPMTDPSGRFTIVYNGEVYNFIELRQELQRLGHSFRGGSDTEVVLAAFAEWGVSSFSKLNGIFAFAVWDRKKQRLILCRDPVGVKPLFYASGTHQITFSSEIKAILGSGHVSREIDPDAIADFFRQNYVSQPSTGFLQIRQLEGGNYLEAHAGEIQIYRYTHFQEVPSMHERDWLEEFRSRWEKTIAQQVVADVPVGAFLSGGLDSTAVAQALRATRQCGVKLFSVRFANPEYDESTIAAATAKHLGIPIEIIDAREDMDDLPEKISPHLEEPTADASALAVYLMCKHASQRVKVALSGDGGDELLAGYETYRASQFTERWKTHRAKHLWSIARSLGAYLPSKDERYSTQQILNRLTFGAALPFPLSHASWRTIQYPETASQLFGEAIQNKATGLDHLARYAATAQSLPAGADSLSRLLHMDFSYYLPNDMLVKVDRMSMAHGLEVRVPFLDPELVRFFRAVPSNWKLRDGKVRKFLLREYLKKAIPEETLRLPKAGFNFPVEGWLRGAWGDRLLDLLRDHKHEIAPYLRPSAVEELLQKHRSRKFDYRHELFGILMFAFWIKNRKEAWQPV